MYVNNQETVFEHTNFRRTSVKGDLDEWVRQKERMRPQPPFWWTLDNDNCWFCKNRNNCGRCRILKRQRAKERKKQNCILSRAAAKKEILTYYTQEGSDNFERD